MGRNLAYAVSAAKCKSDTQNTGNYAQEDAHLPLFTTSGGDFTWSAFYAFLPDSEFVSLTRLGLDSSVPPSIIEAHSLHPRVFCTYRTPLEEPCYGEPRTEYGVIRTMCANRGWLATSSLRSTT